MTTKVEMRVYGAKGLRFPDPYGNQLLWSCVNVEGIYDASVLVQFDTTQQTVTSPPTPAPKAKNINPVFNKGLYCSIPCSVSILPVLPRCLVYCNSKMLQTLLQSNAIPFLQPTNFPTIFNVATVPYQQFSALYFDVANIVGANMYVSVVDTNNAGQQAVLGRVEVPLTRLSATQSGVEVVRGWWREDRGEDIFCKCISVATLESHHGINLHRPSAGGHE
jgi:hypothetical protein